MRPTFKQRFKEMLCKIFGHNKVHSHDFGKVSFYTCKRCHYFVEEAKK